MYKHKYNYRLILVKYGKIPQDILNISSDNVPDYQWICDISKQLKIKPINWDNVNVYDWFYFLYLYELMSLMKTKQLKIVDQKINFIVNGVEYTYYVDPICNIHLHLCTCGNKNLLNQDYLSIQNYI